MISDPALLVVVSLLWKVLATAGIIIVTGRLAWSAGPVLTSILVTLPVNAGPGLFFVSLTLDNAFLRDSTLYTMAGAGPVLVYLTVFVQAARLRRFYLALLIGLGGWCLAAWPIAGIDLSVLEALGCIATGIVFAILCNRRLSAGLVEASAAASWRYLLIRGIVAGVFIAGIATAAPLIGPAAAGLLLSFPTTMSATGWMLNGHYGLDFVAATYASARKAISLYVMFCLVLIATLEIAPGPIAVLMSFLLVAVIGAVFATLLVRVRARTRKPARP